MLNSFIKYQKTRFKENFSKKPFDKNLINSLKKKSG